MATSKVRDRADGSAHTPETPALTPAEMLDSLGQAVIATDPAGRVLYWNHGAEELYGWSAREVLGRNIADLTVSDMSQDVAGQIFDALHEGTAWTGSFPVRRRDGTIFPALVTDAGVYRDGVLVGVVGESTSLGNVLQPLLERSRDAALLLTAQGTVTYASAAVSTLYGWDAETMAGTPLADHLHPDDRDLFAALLSGDPAPGEERSADLRVRGPDGWVWAEVLLTNLVEEPLVRSVVCNLRHSERLTQLAERERLRQAMHVGALQDLFAASLELDALLLRATPGQRPTIESALGSITRAIGVLRGMVNPTPPQSADGR